MHDNSLLLYIITILNFMFKMFWIVFTRARRCFCFRIEISFVRSSHYRSVIRQYRTHVIPHARNTARTQYRKHTIPHARTQSLLHQTKNCCCFTICYAFLNLFYVTPYVYAVVLFPFQRHVIRKPKTKKITMACLFCYECLPLLYFDAIPVTWKKFPRSLLCINMAAFTRTRHIESQEVAFC